MEPHEPRAPGSIHWVDVAIRLALLGGLLAWSLLIVRRFVGFIVWGGILAVALFPLYDRVEKALGGRPKTAAALFVLVPLALLAVPTVLLLDTLVHGVAQLNADYTAGRLDVPLPPEGIESWPLVGKRLGQAWHLAHDDLQAAITTYAPDLERLRPFLVSSVREVALAVGGLLFSLVVMGMFLVGAETAETGLRALSVRIDPTRGDGLVSLACDTMRSVARGIVGVAAIQSLLGGLGFLVVGVPAAGLWALLLLVMAIAQLPTILVLGPIAVYVFNSSETWVAVSFAVFALFVSLLDNILKPMLLGRGIGVPLLVIFSGAIGGVLLQGVVGLFIGPVVLVMTFTLIGAWVRMGSGAAEPAARPVEL